MIEKELKGNFNVRYSKTASQAAMSRGEPRQALFAFQAPSGEDHIVKTIKGPMQVLGSNAEAGYIRVYVDSLKIHDTGEAEVYFDGDYKLPNDCEDFALFDFGHHRVCWARRQNLWRLYPDRVVSEIGNLLVTDYKGIMNVNWDDRKSHLFHDGHVFVDDNKIAHLAVNV